MPRLLSMLVALAVATAKRLPRLLTCSVEQTGLLSHTTCM